MYEPEQQQKQENIPEKQREENPPIFEDVQLGLEIIKVRSKLSTDILAIKMKDDSGIIRIVHVPIESSYKELLTEDVSTANIDALDRAVCNSLAEACSSTRNFAKKHKYSLVNCHDKLANYHNYLMVASKASGFGAQIAKSYFVNTKVDRKETNISEPPKQKGILNSLRGI
jgi:hypothetical protein